MDDVKMYRTTGAMNGSQVLTQDRRKRMHAILVEVVYSNIQHWAPDAICEYTLSNKKIADIYCTFMGERIIVEVKVTLKQSIIDEAISKYWRECDYLLIAAPAEQWNSLMVMDPLMWRDGMQEKIGRLSVTEEGVTLTRAPQRLRAKTGPST